MGALSAILEGLPLDAATSTRDACDVIVRMLFLTVLCRRGALPSAGLPLDLEAWLRGGRGGVGRPLEPGGAGAAPESVWQRFCLASARVRGTLLGAEGFAPWGVLSVMAWEVPGSPERGECAQKQV